MTGSKSVIFLTVFTGGLCGGEKKLVGAEEKHGSRTSVLKNKSERLQAVLWCGGRRGRCGRSDVRCRSDSDFRILDRFVSVNSRSKN